MEQAEGEPHSDIRAEGSDHRKRNCHQERQQGSQKVSRRDSRIGSGKLNDGHWRIIRTVREIKWTGATLLLYQFGRAIGEVISCEGRLLFVSVQPNDFAAECS